MNERSNSEDKGGGGVDLIVHIVLKTQLTVVVNN